jgi:ribosome-associated protein
MSEPQLKAIANEIETRLREDHSIRPVAIDGFPASQWIVLDYLQVVVHVFHRDKRSFYSLEDLWGDAPQLEWERAQRTDPTVEQRAVSRAAAAKR